MDKQCERRNLRPQEMARWCLCASARGGRGRYLHLSGLPPFSLYTMLLIPGIYNQERKGFVRDCVIQEG